MSRLMPESIQKFKDTIEKKTRKKVFSKIESTGVEFISFENDRCYYNGYITYKCKNGHINTQSIRNFMSGRDCYKCRNITISLKQTGSKGNNWQGGKTELRRYIKHNLSDWKKLSMENCNYKCVITGERFDEIHHLYSFSFILDEALKSIKLDYSKSVSEYSQKEIEDIFLKVREIHKKYPLGVCLKRDIHIEFHKKYGHKTKPKDFYEFLESYKSAINI